VDASGKIELDDFSSASAVVAGRRFAFVRGSLLEMVAARAADGERENEPRRCSRQRLNPGRSLVSMLFSLGDSGCDGGAGFGVGFGSVAGRGSGAGFDSAWPPLLSAIRAAARWPYDEPGSDCATTRL
jgi:hypothetical protein